MPDKVCNYITYSSLNVSVGMDKLFHPIFLRVNQVANSSTKYMPHIFHVSIWCQKNIAAHFDW